MRYSKPRFHFLSAANVAAHCVSGTDPGTGHDCTLGGDDVPGNCTGGSGAHAVCNEGGAPGSTCVDGATFGVDCVTGTID
jgi:hypothetical protein